MTGGTKFGFLKPLSIVLDKGMPVPVTPMKTPSRVKEKSKFGFPSLVSGGQQFISKIFGFFFGKPVLLYVVPLTLKDITIYNGVSNENYHIWMGWAHEISVGLSVIRAT